MHEYYFISFNLVNGQCAVERHLSGYIADKYHHTVIPDIRIDSVINDIRAEQERYLSLHRAAKPVPIRISEYKDRFGTNRRIEVGDMYMIITHIRSFEVIDSYQK